MKLWTPTIYGSEFLRKTGRPEEQPPTYYRLLGVKTFESNPDVIQMACNRLMGHVRTFQAGPHAAISQKFLNTFRLVIRASMLVHLTGDEGEYKKQAAEHWETVPVSVRRRWPSTSGKQCPPGAKRETPKTTPSSTK